MRASMESTDRQPTDYFHFAITFFGILLCVASVVTLSVVTAIFGLLMIALGLAYFLMGEDAS